MTDHGCCVSDDAACDRCKTGAAKQPHPCPFKKEIRDDAQTLCNCCDECEKQCAYDI